MIRILMVVGSFQYGGIMSFLMELYRKINKKFIQFDFVSVLCENNSIMREIVDSGGRIYNCPHYRNPNFSLYRNHLNYVRWWDDFWKNHTEYRILHGHYDNTMFLYIPIAKQYGCKTISHAHGRIEDKGGIGLIKRLLQLSVRWSADYYFTASQELGEYFYGKSATETKKYFIVPNGIDADRFSFNLSTRNKIRKKIGWDNNFIIGHVGRLVPIKNQCFLLDVFRIISQKCSIARLLIVGDGELRHALEERAKCLGVDDKVIFTGGKDDSEVYYQGMDVFVLPSFSEGLSIVCVEAQAAGLPCVVSTGVPQQADMGGALMIKKALSDGAEAWAESILSFINIAREDGSGLVKKAGFDMENTAEWLEEFYQNIIHN